MGGGWVAGEVENIAISTQVEVVVDLKLELSLAIYTHAHTKVCIEAACYLKILLLTNPNIKHEIIHVYLP